MRLSANGAVDTAFTTNLTFPTPSGHSSFLAYGLVVLPDDSIVIASIGSDWDVYNPQIVLAKVRRNGGVDTEFGTAGMAVISVLGGISSTNVIVAETVDGKIIVAGTPTALPRRVLLARVHANGSLDADFGEDGIVTDQLTDDSHDVLAMNIDPNDGSILLAGTMSSSSPIFNSDFFVARYTANGVRDTTFAGAGYMTVDSGHVYDEAKSIAILPDGSYVFGGTTAGPSHGNRMLCVARVSRLGQIDESFGSGGIYTLYYPHADADTDYRGLSVQRDGKIVTITGHFIDASTQTVLTRLTSNGQLDTTFGMDGTGRIAREGVNTYGVHLQDRSRMLMLGAFGSTVGISRIILDSTDPALPTVSGTDGSGGGSPLLAAGSDDSSGCGAGAGSGAVMGLFLALVTSFRRRRSQHGSWQRDGLDPSAPIRSDYTR